METILILLGAVLLAFALVGLAAAIGINSATKTNSTKKRK